MSFSPHKDNDVPPVPDSDRRLHPRQPIVPRLYVILDAAKTDGILNDASETGVALDIVGPAPQEEFIAVDFEMSEIGQRFEARGRIMWRDDATRKVGVHFDDLPEASRSQIRKWLAKKAPAIPIPVATAGVPAIAPTALNPISMEPQISSPTPPAIPVAPVIPVVPALPAAPEQQPILKPVGEKNYEVVTGSRSETVAGTAARSGRVPPKPAPVPPPASKDDTERDRIVQNLLESFSQPTKNAPHDAAIKPGSPGMFSSGPSVSPEGGRRWMALTIAAGAALILVLGVLAYRSPAHNAGTISVSKIGLPPNSSNSANPNSPSHGGGAPGGNTPTGSASNSSAPPGAATTSPSSCVPLGSPSDRVRLFLWAEKETPQAIVDAYLKNLSAVQDVRVVDQPPYDLVLYVNGANVDAKGPDPSYLWSSRVFRPWHCGPGMSQLEQTELNESLHYVQNGQIDQRVQSEVAYLILHTFESIRNEGQK